MSLVDRQKEAMKLQQVLFKNAETLLATGIEVSNAIQLNEQKFQEEKTQLEEELSQLKKQLSSGNSYLVNDKQLQVFKEKKLGSGSYGTVYLGRYYKTPVAIKELNEKQTNQAAKRYFIREAEILTHLKHPNIVSCFGYSLDGDTPFIIMQLMDQKYFRIQISTNIG